MTKYQLLRLKDEAQAFQQELAFWQKAPEWFRKHFEGKKIKSHLFSKKMGFAEYYNHLEKSKSKKENFIVARYIDLEQAPKCAAKVAKRIERKDDTVE